MSLYNHLMKWPYKFQGVLKVFLWYFMALSLYLPPNPKRLPQKKTPKGCVLVTVWLFPLKITFKNWKNLKGFFRFFVWHSFLFIWPQNFKRDHLASDRLSTILKYPLFKYRLPLKRKWNPMNVQSTHSLPLKCTLWKPDMTHLYLWLIKRWFMQGHLDRREN